MGRFIKKIHRPPERGFTLMELLVVLTIFTTVVVTATDIFILTNRSQRKIFGYERTQADARFSMEAMTREVRTGAIDYEYYDVRGTPIGAPEAELALIDSSGESIVFSESVTGVNEDKCPDAISTPCLLVTVGANEPASITPKGVRILNVKFYISPIIDPSTFDIGTGTYPSEEQPRVTIVMMAESKEMRDAERSVVYLQTTVANRAYVR